MARKEGVYRREDSRYWWINATLPNGQRIRQSAGTESREDAEALLAKLKLDAYRGHHFGIKPQRSWQEAVVRYVELKRGLRSISDVRRVLRYLDPYLGNSMLNQINGDMVWRIVQGEFKKGNKPATVNRYLSVLRNLLRMARDEWQWIDTMPKIRMLGGEVERDRWLTRAEADRLIACCAPHLAALVRYALATGCRAGEITGLEWDRVDLSRNTAWLNQTKNGTPRGVPLNVDAVQVLREQLGKHARYCFTTRVSRSVGSCPTPAGWGRWSGRASRTSASTTCGIPGRLGIVRQELPATSSRTWAAGSRGRWWTAMPSSQRRTCCLRRLESSAVG
eukprot:TRINITY_DN16701_c0_g1_i2.p1 TRINITY_DN16701_c0_g1~~TRINITY_DN16701_c0_g1_i2.p1  ORF type:complete len:353 (+),score=25.19 TRINITY_DN16701_c0_g1_i2:55-1059(+)